MAVPRVAEELFGSAGIDESDPDFPEVRRIMAREACTEEEARQILSEGPGWEALYDEIAALAQGQLGQASQTGLGMTIEREPMAKLILRDSVTPRGPAEAALPPPPVDEERLRRAQLGRIHRDRLQETLEREVYPRIGKDRFKPNGTLKVRPSDFSSTHWQKIVGAMEKHQITSYDNAAKYVAQQEAQERAREAAYAATRPYRTSVPGIPRSEQVLAGMPPKDAARAGTRPSTISHYPGAAYDVLWKEPLVGSAENFGYTAGLHDAGQASDWEFYRDAALLSTQLGLTAGELYGLGRLGVAAAEQRAFQPFHRYVSPGKDKSGPWLTRGWKAPYGENWELAKDKLQLEHLPTEVNRVRVPVREYVAGPRPAVKNPQWGRGGGLEWVRDRRFRD